MAKMLEIAEALSTRTVNELSEKDKNDSRASEYDRKKIKGG